MSFIRFSTAEGGTNTTAVTVANSGTSGYAFTTVNGVVNYSSTVAQSGSLSYQFASGTPYVYWTLPGLAETVWLRSWFYVASSLPTATVYLHYGTSSGGATPYTAMAANTGKLFVNNGTTVNGTYTYAVNTWYRLETELWFSGTQFQVIAKVYDNSGNLLETITSSVSSSSYVTLTQAYFWGSNTTTVYQDNLAVSDQGWIGAATSFTLWKINTAEGGTNAAALTVANSGGLPGDAVDFVNGTSITFDSTYTQSGLSSYKLAGTAGYTRWNLPGNMSVLYMRAYIYFTAFSTTDEPLYVLGDANVHHGQILLAGGHWSPDGGFTYGTTTPVTGVWYRIEFRFTFGTGTAQGTARIYNSSGTLLETITGISTQTLTVPQYASWGQVASYAPSYWLDNLAVSDQGWIGAATQMVTLGTAVTTSGTAGRQPGKALPSAAVTAGTFSRQWQAVRAFTATVGTSSQPLWPALTYAPGILGPVVNAFTAPGGTGGGPVLTRQVARTLPVAAVTAGTLTRQPSKTFTAAAAAAGSLTRQAARTVTATVTVAGTLTRQAGKALTVTAVTFGNLTRQVARTLPVAAVTTGTLTRQAARTLTGLVTPAATAARRPGKALPVTAVTAGAFSRQWQAVRAFTATVGTTGTVTRQTTRTLTMAVATAVTWSRTFPRTFAAAVITAGTLARQPGKTLTVTVTTAGLLGRQAAKAWTVAVAATGAGTLTRQAGRAFTATVTTTGAVARQATHALTGNVTTSGGFTGTTAKMIQKPIRFVVGAAQATWRFGRGRST